MKKRILIISILICLIVPLSLVIAKNTTVSKNIAIFTSFKMEILEDGKLTDNKMLVDLRVVNVDGDNNISVDWNHVYINPVHETKTVILKAQHFSTLEGSIKNVIANNNSFSFVIDLSGTLFGAGRTVQVVGNKKVGQDGCDIEATALWWSDIINRKIKTEWQSTDKVIVLPYKEAFFGEKRQPQIKPTSVVSNTKEKNPVVSVAEEIVFTGIPEIKIRLVNGSQGTPEKLSQAKSIEYKCTITKMDNKYYWTTRENVELIPIQSAHPRVWTTFIAANGSGYVRVIDPEMKKIFYKEGELPYDYMEHLLLNLSTITYYGTSK